MALTPTHDVLERQQRSIANARRRFTLVAVRCRVLGQQTWGLRSELYFTAPPVMYHLQSHMYFLPHVLVVLYVVHAALKQNKINRLNVPPKKTPAWIRSDPAMDMAPLVQFVAVSYRSRNRLL